MKNRIFYPPGMVVEEAHHDDGLIGQHVMSFDDSKGEDFMQTLVAVFGTPDVIRADQKLYFKGTNLFLRGPDMVEYLQIEKIADLVCAFAEGWEAHEDATNPGDAMKNPNAEALRYLTLPSAQRLALAHASAGGPPKPWLDDRVLSRLHELHFIEAQRGLVQPGDLTVGDGSGQILRVVITTAGRQHLELLDREAAKASADEN